MLLFRTHAHSYSVCSQVTYVHKYAKRTALRHSALTHSRTHTLTNCNLYISSLIPCMSLTLSFSVLLLGLATASHAASQPESGQTAPIFGSTKFPVGLGCIAPLGLCFPSALLSTNCRNYRQRWGKIHSYSALTQTHTSTTHNTYIAHYVMRTIIIFISYPHTVL